MQEITNNLIKEKVFIEKLDNGMTVMIIPKHETDKKYVIWGFKIGSNDNHFIDPITNQEVIVPDGIAHYLEHKMFENESGIDSLMTLMSLGLDANAYTTNDHTAYLFSGTDNFYEGLDELMDYVQHPYYTDENVEKERPIISQEIGKYDDMPSWRLYINAVQNMYHNNTVRIDTAGTVETISHITKENLYSCYNTFYNPANSIMCISGDFNPKEIISEIKKRLLKKEKINSIKRIYPEEPETINRKIKEEKMDVNMPLFMIGFKNNFKDNKLKMAIASDIILNSIIGKCSELYQELYNNGTIMSELEVENEFSTNYSHILIAGETKNPKETANKIIETIINSTITEEQFERSKKRVYGELVKEFNDVEDIGRLFLQSAIKGYNGFDYITELENITLEQVLKYKDKIFREKNSTISIITSK